MHELHKIRAFVKRAIHNCSTHEYMHQEFARIKQLLVNNGYRNKDIDSEIKRQLDHQYNDIKTTGKSKTTHHLFYKNFMNTEYKTDERTLKHIVKKHVKCSDETHQLKLHVYYQNRKTKHLIMRNNPVRTKNIMQTNVLYKFDCPFEDCRLRQNSYVGFTCTTLSRRLTMHKQHGSIKTHME